MYTDLSIETSFQIDNFADNLMSGLRLQRQFHDRHLHGVPLGQLDQPPA
jgi:hypothetical protein